MARYLEISSVSLRTPAWTVRDLLPLVGWEWRGQNLVVPGVDGSIALARKIAEREVTLELVIRGQYDQAGTPHANARQGLQTNISYLVSNIGDVPGTQPAVLHLDSGSTLSADVQVTLRFSAISHVAARATLDLVIPEGGFS